MARYHWWGFIVNEAGEPIENAEITVKVANSDVLADIYYDEFGNANSADNPALSAGPQLSTLSNGYYEFWIGDVTQPYGYSNDTKFKLEWIRLGVAYGEIDYINVFPLGPQTYPVSLTDCTNPSKTFDKLISDYLACKWDIHVESEVVLDSGEFSSVHGLEFITINQFGEVTGMDEVPNKIFSNYYAWHWDWHRLSTVQDYHPSAGRPHNMAEVDPYDGSDSLRNKLVSNLDLFNLHTADNNLRVYVDDADINLQSQIDNLSWTTDQSRSGWWKLFNTDWIEGDYDQWYVDIHHDMNIYYPLVLVYDEGTNKVISTADIEYVSDNVIRVTIQNNNSPNPPTIECIVRIGNGGVHRYPPINPPTP